MRDAAPHGWVLPEWPALARRPLILGLPYTALGTLLIVVGVFAIVLQVPVAALVLLVALWALGIALTRYDPWGWEILIRAARQARRLMAR